MHWTTNKSVHHGLSSIGVFTIWVYGPEKANNVHVYESKVDAICVASS